MLSVALSRHPVSMLTPTSAVPALERQQFLKNSPQTTQLTSMNTKPKLTSIAVSKYISSLSLDELDTLIADLEGDFASGIEKHFDAEPIQIQCGGSGPDKEKQLILLTLRHHRATLAEGKASKFIVAGLDPAKCDGSGLGYVEISKASRIKNLVTQQEEPVDELSIGIFSGAKPPKE